MSSEENNEFVTFKINMVIKIKSFKFLDIEQKIDFLCHEINKHQILKKLGVI